MPGGSADFPEAYAALAEGELPAFITADSVLRVADLLIDRVLRTVEDDYLYDRLEQLSREMTRLLEDDYLRTSDTTLREAARRDLAFFAVGLSLMDPNYFPPESVKSEFFSEPTGHSTHCPWKGDASYRDVTVGGDVQLERFRPTVRFAIHD